LRYQYAAVHALGLMILVQIQHVVMMTMAERNQVRDNLNQVLEASIH